MAIAATELRPRTAVMLFDAAVRLATRSTALWAITLPGGAAVTVAAIHFLDQARAGEEGWAPALWLTGAWFFRAVCQGAASHWRRSCWWARASPAPPAPSWRPSSGCPAWPSPPWC